MGQEMNGLRQKKEALFREKTSLEGERDNLTGTVETKGEIIVGLNTRIAQTQLRMKELDEELQAAQCPGRPSHAVDGRP